MSPRQGLGVETSSVDGFEPQQIWGSFSVSPVPAFVKTKCLVPAVMNLRGSHPE